MKKISQKAQRIYKATRYHTWKHIEAWGYNHETDGGWAGGWITTDDNPDGELIYQRTQNELMALLESDLRRFDRGKRLGIYKDDPDKEKLEASILLMMLKTAKNQYISGKTRF